MHDQVTTPSDVGGGSADTTAARAAWRARGRDVALQNALRKRAAGVPTYSVPEAAALLSISQEHLYRLVRADAFPALRMRVGGDQGRYVVPAKAVELLLEVAAAAGGRTDIAEWAASWADHVAGAPAPSGGAA